MKTLVFLLLVLSTFSTQALELYGTQDGSVQIFVDGDKKSALLKCNLKIDSSLFPMVSLQKSSVNEFVLPAEAKMRDWWEVTAIEKQEDGDSLVRLRTDMCEGVDSTKWITLQLQANSKDNQF